MRYLNSVFTVLFILIAAFSFTGCTTNPATGKSQFTALMSPAQENQVGAQEHQNIVKQYGLYDNPSLVNYVRSVGQRVAGNTERPDVQYQFYIIDSPIVNAFALPGGYIYVSRGLLALANSEAELAAVLAHETGHITGRHSAERYSQAVVTSLGTSLLASAIDSSGAAQALGLGSDLYLSSYSRGQENEADTLGLRYLTRGGYDPAAMYRFLSALKEQSALEARLNGQRERGFDFFSTHPATQDRIQNTLELARQYPQSGVFKRDEYLRAIDGMVYGDSPAQGFIRGQKFIHPNLGFQFEVPAGFRLINQSSEVIAVEEGGSVIIFDMASRPSNVSAAAYLQNSWMKNERLQNLETIDVNGMNAATATFSGSVNNRAVTIRLVAIEFGSNRFARMQMAIPTTASAAKVEQLKRTTYSFEKLSPQQAGQFQPQRVSIVTAGTGDTLSSLARRQPFTSLQEERFRTLNALAPGDTVEPGQKYKLITQ